MGRSGEPRSNHIRAWRGRGAALALFFGLLCAASGAAAQSRDGQARDWGDGAEPSSQAVAPIVDWVIASGDNRGRPFAIVDKVAAELFVFGGDGQLRGVTPVLIGSARGDESSPGVGERELSAILPEERTTPAGRFVAGYGPATGGKTVLWVDYATSISLHPVIDTDRKEQRPKRLRSPSPEDNRITYGCINVSAAFYEEVVRPSFTGGESVVYVLPEATPLEQVFPAVRTHRGLAAARSGRSGSRFAAH